MSKEWWEMTEEELALDGQARVARQIAYVNTFYRNRESFIVLLDIKRMASRGYNEFTSEGAIAVLARKTLIAEIRANAGCSCQTELAMIEAEAQSIVIETPEEEGEQ
jgi:hypothetical protein